MKTGFDQMWTGNVHTDYLPDHYFLMNLDAW